ncbi:MAG: guanylate kinase [Nitrospinae bacterium]|nr:guanylate kinase [Nitrospinota bacterium]
MKSKGILFVVSAPSGAGKTTISKKITEIVDDIYHSISHTTRPPRPDEIDGKHYYFVSKAEFEEMIKREEFIEWASVHGNYYGTSVNNLDIVKNQKKDLLLVIDVQGAEQLRKKHKTGCYIFILPPSMKTLEKRLRARGADSDEEIRKRLKTAEEEIHHYKTYNYIIINDDIDDAVHQLKSIIFAERCRYPNFIPELPDLKL